MSVGDIPTLVPVSRSGIAVYVLPKLSGKAMKIEVISIPIKHIARILLFLLLAKLVFCIFFLLICAKKFSGGTIYVLVDGLNTYN
jgi:hypothetical protein